MKEFATSKAGVTLADSNLKLQEIIKNKPDRVAIYRGADCLFPQISCAARFMTRLRGLMFYPHYPNFDGLLLIPCQSVHMFWMCFPLDLVYLALDGRILTTVSNLAPGRVGPSFKKAVAVLELPVGTLKNYQIEKDEIFTIKSVI